MNDSFTYEAEIRVEAELMSLAYERDSRRYVRTIDWEEEADK